ncbi:hypothetical protein [Nodularia sp. UHCC 0506]|uniref:hypothetical protein n=1 Tax=Nodularia sp. UHCC 0506 TaxID=3110243 RepID=UPI002B201E6A|nr:hypothetical protein [Nodularia sp. UHCC 0506]MEA5515525.1 hypothetical protein [Nodularia sp. UHCC 0506]
MKIKTFTYQRVLNLGNYESKRLEASIELDVVDQMSSEEECTALMDMVERKIREETGNKIASEIRDARKELREIYQEIESAQRLLAELGRELKREPDDEINFDSEVSEGGDF